MLAWVAVWAVVAVAEAGEGSAVPSVGKAVAAMGRYVLCREGLAVHIILISQGVVLTIDPIKSACFKSVHLSCTLRLPVLALLPFIRHCLRNVGLAQEAPESVILDVKYIRVKIRYMES
jgi:hypothetical protein